MINTKHLLFTAALVAGVSVGAWALPGWSAVPAFDSWSVGQQPARVPEIPVSSAGYTDGTFIGRREFAYYGTVQVEAIIRGGNIVRIRFLSYPNDNGTSRYISSVAIPRLRREALSVQGSHVRHVSGATFTSQAFHLSLHTALLQAVN